MDIESDAKFKIRVNLSVDNQLAQLIAAHGGNLNFQTTTTVTLPNKTEQTFTRNYNLAAMIKEIAK